MSVSLAVNELSLEDAVSVLPWPLVVSTYSSSLIQNVSETKKEPEVYRTYR